MNWNEIEGNWREFKGTIQERWGKLTDSDIDRIAGNREKLVGQLQSSYGKSREDVERELDLFVEGMKRH